MPVYNGAAMMTRALRSIQRQTLRDFECLVVDDGSADDTFAVARRFADSDPRFLALRHDRNQGVSAARNTGIRAAAADWIAIHDCDDLMHPRRLEWQHAEALRVGRPCVIGGHYVESLGGGRRVVRRLRYSTRPYNELLRHYVGCGSIFMVARACLEDVGPFDPSFNTAEELDLLLRLTRKYPLHVVDKAVALYDGEPRPTRNSFTCEGVVRLSEVYGPEILRVHGRRVLEQHLLFGATLLRLRGRRTEAARLLARAMRLWPLDHHAWRQALLLARDARAATKTANA
jgi:glycosyltransferase involved in cell wall biosynthesis